MNPLTMISLDLLLMMQHVSLYNGPQFIEFSLSSSFASFLCESEYYGMNNKLPKGRINQTLIKSIQTI
ncbi:unnamed protein product [Rhizophagus irregularis]|nr:unnamed protein product [Rhizophagus irregularis]